MSGRARMPCRVALVVLLVAGLTVIEPQSGRSQTLDTPPDITLTGPTIAGLETAATYSGTVTAAGLGLGLIDVEILIDESPVATVQTDAQGKFTTTVFFDVLGGNDLQAVVYRGTALEARSPVLVVDVAPSIDPTVATTLASASEFLYTGTDPLQTGVTAGAIDPARVAVVRGKVLQSDGSPLADVSVTVEDRPQLGATRTRADGVLDIAVNGGGQLTIRLEKEGYLPVERHVEAPWQDYIVMPDVVMTHFDSQVTTIDLSSSEPVQVARGSEISDEDGTRRATLLFSQDTNADMIMPGGAAQPLAALDVRATEYTVGGTGPSAMPAPLPATSAYTYAVELSVDEAVAAGATEVRFDRPVAFYAENFLGFPVGGPVPTAYYDRQDKAWVPSDDGRIVKIVSVSDGRADLDVDGDGQPDTGTALAELGISDAERAELAELYSAGQSLWRVQITHFSSWDHNWPYVGPDGAVAPSLAPTGNAPEDDNCEQPGSIIECQSQVLGESVGLSGTPFSLNYRSDRVPGGRSYLDIPLSGASIPASLERIELDVFIAGTTHHREFFPEPHQSHRFDWDRKDALGRVIQGAQQATVRVSYVYGGGRYCEPREFRSTFGSSCVTPLGVPARENVVLSQEWSDTVGPAKLRNWDARGQGLGGWTLDAHHAYDPGGRVLYEGTGRRRSAQGANRITIESVAPSGGVVNRATGVAAAPNGSLYIADTDNHRIRRVDASGVITTIAGDGAASNSGDGGPATLAQLSSPHDVALASDGSLYIADTGNHRIRKIDPEGRMTTIAGTGESGYSGDGGPASDARLSAPTDVELLSSGAFYLADRDNHRIRLVDTSGVITTIAGSGTPGFGGDGGQAIAAKLWEPRGVAEDGGKLYIADTRNHRVRRVATDGTISTLAGTGNDINNGNDGPAGEASLDRPVGVDVGPDAAVYVSARDEIRRVGADGIITKVVGGYEYGDGGLATEADILHWNGGLTITSEGVLFIASDSDSLIRRVDAEGIITTVAGTRTEGYAGDGGQAAGWRLKHPEAIVVAPDGSAYIADSRQDRVLRVDPSGQMSVAAGIGYCDYTGDGGPAVEAALCEPVALALGPDGSLYIADYGFSVIRRISPEGVISTMAGNGDFGFTGDDVVATETALRAPEGVAVGPDGSIYIADSGNHRVRKVGPDGIITTIVGDGTSGFGGDGGAATSAQLAVPHGVAVGPDGAVYIAEFQNERIRRVNPSGVISTVAGDGSCDFRGDGGPATEASLCSPTSVALSDDGVLYIADRDNGRIRTVTQDGVIATVAGDGDFFGFDGDGGPASLATLSSANGVTVGPQGDVYIADTQNHRIRRIAPHLPGFDATERIIPSQDGSELHVFSAEGRHLRTLDALSNSLRYSFLYDDSGRLSTIEDSDGNQTTIERDAAGTPTTVVSPYGQRTVLAINPEGYLASVTNPAGEKVSFGYAEGGLLSQLTDPRGNLHEFTFNSSGRLTKDEDPSGGSTSLERSGNATDYTVTATTAEGRVTTYRVMHQADGDQRRVVTAPGGAKTEAVIKPGGTQTITSPDGTMSTTRVGPDPRWGMLAPVVDRLTTTMPSGKSSSVTARRLVTLQDRRDLLSLIEQTDKIISNDKLLTRRYDAAVRTLTETSPAGRRSVTTLDARGRIASTKRGELAESSFSYDARGRLSSVTQGSGTSARTTSFDYGPDGYLAVVTDPLTQTRFDYDLAGRMVKQTLPDDAEVALAYDAAGNLSSLIPPERAAHGFGYTPVDLMQRYTPPSLDDQVDYSTSHAYNLDKQQIRIDQPGGRTIDLAYDSGGRLSSQSFSKGSIDYSYDPTSSRLARIAAPGASAIAFGYDGSLTTQVTSEGPVPGAVAYSYDADLRVASRSIDGAPATPYSYDQDGLVTGAGELGLSWDLQGLLADSTLGGVTTSASRDGFGELASERASFGGSDLYDASYQRDALGRISAKTETVAGESTTYAYTYDPRGRLTEVTKDGAPYRSYGYDTNGNRTSATEDGGAAITGTYDAQDRLTSYGSTTYAYNAMGQRTSKTAGSDTTTYDYDELGNLMEVALPTKSVSYIVDGQGRRVASKVDGTTTNRYLYGQGILPIAELNADGSVKSQFVFASKAQVPDLMTKANVTYRFVTDNIGSVRMVVNTTDGTIAQRIDYDPFGKVISDTNPGFQPFGFAGGLYDTDTGLVRFGARDYDPEVGRFTIKDPILFEGGDTNLYAYVGSDPLNRIDPFGLDWLEDLNDSVGGFVDGLTTVPFTDFSLMGALRDHMVDGGIAADVNVCSWGYGYADRIGQLEQAGLSLIVAGPAAGSRWFKKNIFSFNRNSEGGPVVTFFRGALRYVGNHNWKYGEIPHARQIEFFNKWRVFHF